MLPFKKILARAVCSKHSFIEIVSSQRCCEDVVGEGAWTLCAALSLHFASHTCLFFCKIVCESLYNNCTRQQSCFSRGQAHRCWCVSNHQTPSGTGAHHGRYSLPFQQKGSALRFYWQVQQQEHLLTNGCKTNIL